jgi:hypothetical protein
MAEEGCTALSVMGASGEFATYFKDHNFTEEGEVLTHRAYPGEFFKPCAGCSEK